jgi:hypothetical protein
MKWNFEPLSWSITISRSEPDSEKSPALFARPRRHARRRTQSVFASFVTFCVRFSSACLKQPAHPQRLRRWAGEP